MRDTRVRFALLVLMIATAPLSLHAQRGGRGGPPPTAQASAAFDLTGYWVSVITEDWRFRMVRPDPGVYGGLTLNAEGRRVADGWDPDGDEARGEECKAYGAAAIMRMPGRLHVTWEDPNTLRIDTDSGMQTRLLRFAAGNPGSEEATWQGHSAAEWQPGPGGGGTLKVVTTNMRSGYVRTNGAPYSDQTVLTEYFNVNTLPNGDRYMTETSIADDPVYFSGRLLTSSDFKSLPDDTGWDPTPCRAQ